MRAQTTVTSPPVGVMSRTLDRGLSGLAIPLVDADLFVGGVVSNAGDVVRFPPSHRGLGALLVSGGRYYLEVATGSLAGERLDVNTEATLESADSTITLDLGAGSFSTLPVLSGNALAGARCHLRRHVTLARLKQMLTPGLSGHDNALRADGVDVLEGGRIVRYTLGGDGATWRRGGSSLDFRGKVLPPDASFVVEARQRPQAWRHAGAVRTNTFRKNLVRGLQPFATGFPVDLSPAQVEAATLPSAPPRTGWTGHNLFLFADQFQLVLGEPRPWELFYLTGNGSKWRALGDPDNVANDPILGATSLILLRRINADPSYRIPSPVAP